MNHFSIYRIFAHIITLKKRIIDSFNNCQLIMYCVPDALYTRDTLMSKIDKILGLMELTV